MKPIAAKDLRDDRDVSELVVAGFLTPPPGRGDRYPGLGGAEGVENYRSERVAGSETLPNGIKDYVMKVVLLLILALTLTLPASASSIEHQSVSIIFGLEDRILMQGAPTYIKIDLSSESSKEVYINIWNNTFVAEDNFTVKLRENQDLRMRHYRELPIKPNAQATICSVRLAPREKIQKKYPLHAQLDTNLPVGKYSLQIDIESISVKENDQEESVSLRNLQVVEGLEFEVIPSAPFALREKYHAILSDVTSLPSLSTLGRWGDDFAAEPVVLLFCFAWGRDAAESQTNLLLSERGMNELTPSLRIMAYQNILENGTPEIFMRILNRALADDFICNDSRMTDPILLWCLQSIPSEIQDTMPLMKDLKLKCQKIIDPRVMEISDRASF